MERLLAVGISFLLALFVGKQLLAPGKNGKTGQTKNTLWANWLLPIAAGAGALAGLLPCLGREGQSFGRFFAGLLLAGCFAAVGRMDEALERAGGLRTYQRCLLFGAGALAYGGVISLWGEGIWSLAIPFLGQVRLGGIMLPVLALCGIAAGESFAALREWDGLCLCFTWAGSGAVLCCAGILGLPVAGVLAGALLGGALGSLLWNLVGARLAIGFQGTLLCAGLLCAACFACGLPLLLLLLLPLPLINRLAEVLSGKNLSLRLSEKGMSGRVLATLWFLAALLCGGVGIAWVWSMYGR